MKNLKKVFAVLFCCSLIFALSACSGGSDSQTDAGKYVFKSMSMEGKTITAEEMAAADISTSDIYIELKDDGTGSLSLFGDPEEITWADGEIKSTNGGGELDYTVKDGVLTLEADDASIEFKRES